MKIKLRLYDWLIIVLCTVLVIIFLLTKDMLYLSIVLGIVSGVLVARLTLERGLKKAQKENFMQEYPKLMLQNILIYAILFIIMVIINVVCFAFSAVALIIYRNLFLNSHKQKEAIDVNV